MNEVEELDIEISYPKDKARKLMKVDRAAYRTALKDN